MRSSFALLALSASLTVAHRDFWQINLPKCWQNCFSKTEDGCASSGCESRQHALVRTLLTSLRRMRLSGSQPYIPPKRGDMRRVAV